MYDDKFYHLEIRIYGTNCVKHSVATNDRKSRIIYSSFRNDKDYADKVSNFFAKIRQVPSQFAKDGGH